MYAKNFPRPMGIAFKDKQLAIANKSKVDLYSRSEALAKSFPSKKNHYDTLYVPQVTYYTGMADIHEIEWGDEGLWAVNTAFSCLSLMDEQYSFVPKWQPNFITDLTPDDRCHLNGLAMKNGQPAYVSVFDKTNEKDGWRNGDVETGMIIDVNTNKVLIDHLPMPHSPFYCNDSIYFLLSATGEVMEYNLTENSCRVITQLNNFIRGFEVYKDFLIVGASELRESSSAFNNISELVKKGGAGIFILDRSTGDELAKITFTDHIKEIFSVRLIENTSRAAIVTEKDEEAYKFIHAPNQLDYWLKED